MIITGRNALIYDALMTHVLLMETQEPVLPVSVPEPIETFVPPTDNDGAALPYLEAMFVPNAPKWQGLSTGQIKQGMIQVAVVWPKNQGLVAPIQVTDAVEAHFAKNTVLISGGVKVRIHREPWTAAPLPDDIETRSPVMIEWINGG